MGNSSSSSNSIIRPMACSGFYELHLLRGLPRSLLPLGLHREACSSLAHTSQSCLYLPVLPFVENTPNSLTAVRLQELGISDILSTPAVYAACNMVTSRYSRRRQVRQELQHVEVLPRVLHADNGKFLALSLAHAGACAYGALPTAKLLL
jgi:hypothetical protein